MSKFYLYRHIRPDLNVPFYIGIGTKRERTVSSSLSTEYERAFTFTKRSKYWNNIFFKNAKNIEVEILFESDSTNEIKEKEKEFIALYGRWDLENGPLVNFTDGGQGTYNYIFSEDHRSKISKGLLALNLKRSDETKNKISQSNKGRPRTKEWIDKFKESRKNYSHTKETVEKILNSRKGYKHSEETKEKIRLAHIGKPKHKWSKEQIERLSKSMKGRVVSSETRLKLSKVNIGKKHTDETRKKMVDAWSSRGPMSDETKLKIGIANKGKKRPPISEETRNKLRISHLGKTFSKETREKISIGNLGKKHSAESKIKIGLASKGRNIKKI